MNPILVIEEYLGRDLTAESAKQIATAPDAHIVGLLKSVESFYFDWLEKAETDNKANTEDCLYCIDPPFGNDLQKQLNYYKRCLLYMPRFAISDPLAAVVKPAFTLAQMSGTITIDAGFRADLMKALSLLAGLSAPSKTQGIVIMPTAFAVDYQSVQDGVQADLAALDASPNRNAYYDAIQRAIEEICRNEGAPAPPDLDYESETKYCIEETKVSGQLCSRLDLVPIAGSEITHAILQQEYALGTVDQTISRSVQQMAKALARYDLPGIGNVDMAAIQSVREGEKAFDDFRREFANVMTTAVNQKPSDQRQFEVEFQQACDDLLRPRIDVLTAATKSSVMEKMFIPAALTIGAGVVAYQWNDAVAVTTAVGVGATPLNWLLDKIRRRWNASGRKATALVEAYGLLSDFKAKT